MPDFMAHPTECDRFRSMNEQPTKTFEAALAERVAAMADACTQCGKCFEACPITDAAGIADAEPRTVLAGVVDILRLGDGNEAARKWAKFVLALRRMHQGLRLWRQSALHAGDGAHEHGACRERAREQRRIGVERFPQGRARRDQHLAHATRRRVAGAAGAEGRKPEGRGRAGHAAGLRVLHRLQRAQDPAHRAARPRHHGCHRRHLSGDGRAEPLLRRGAGPHRRRRDLRDASRKPPWTSSRRASPARWCRGARAATCSSPRRRCRRSRRRAAQSRSR